MRVRMRVATAVFATLALGGSALVAAGPASAESRSFLNSIVTPQTDDTDISSLAAEITPRTLTLSIAVDNLQTDPTAIHFYLMQRDTVANASGQVERVFSVSSPDTPGGAWGTNGYVRGSSGADQPGPFTGALTRTTSGATTTFVLTVTDPVTLPWSGSTWVAATFREPDNTYKSAGVAQSDGFHGFGPVNDLSIPVAVNVALSYPSQLFGRSSATLSGGLQPAATGTIEVFDGITSLGTQSVVEAAPVFAFALPNSLAIGSHSLHAVFTPATARFGVGSSPSITLSVLDPNARAAKTPTKVTIKLSHSVQHYKHARVKATITVAGKHAGTVRLYDGKHKIRTLRLKKGRATYTFSSKLSKRKHVLKVVYLPSSAAFASSTSKKVTLKVVK